MPTPATTTAMTATELADAVTDLAGLALAFASVDRSYVYWADQVTPESDSDHTVMLAWVAAALAELLCPDLDPADVVAAAVVHDAVEAIPGCGDTPTLRIDAAGRAAKAVREAEAADEWERRFGTRLPWIARMIRRYEAKVTKADRFVWSVDKMLPRIVHAYDRCTGLHEIGMTVAELAEDMPETTAKITGYGEFPQLEAVAVEFGHRLAAVHAQTLPGGD